MCVLYVTFPHCHTVLAVGYFRNHSAFPATVNDTPAFPAAVNDTPAFPATVNDTPAFPANVNDTPAFPVTVNYRIEENK